MIDSSSESVASAIKQMCPISGEAQPCCGELAKLWNLESIAYVAILFPLFSSLAKNVKMVSSSVSLLVNTSSEHV